MMPAFIAQGFCTNNVKYLGEIIRLSTRICNWRSGSLYVVARPSVVCRLSLTLVHPSQAVEVFGIFSTLFGTFAIHWRPWKKFTEIVPWEPLRPRGVKRKRGSQIQRFWPYRRLYLGKGAR